MYLGIDSLISQGVTPFVIDVNVGLPGGAQEYELTHQVYLKRPSGIFKFIETTSQEVYGKSFQEYLQGLPFIEALKPFKIWMDGMGPFPNTFHPGLRLEDKWVQYQLLHSIFPVPETRCLDLSDLTEAEGFLEKKSVLVLKRRVGRGGRGLHKIYHPEEFSRLKSERQSYLLQEYIESSVDGFHFSIRSVAFGGRFICMYANLSTRSISNHGILAFVTPGEGYGLQEKVFKTETFNQRSWEAKIWFERSEPSYLRHNLYEDVVARTALQIPVPTFHLLQDLSIKIERLYETIDLSHLPKACFEA